MTTALPAGASKVAADPARASRLKAAEKDIRRDAGNDSLKYELALALAAMGTIDERTRSLQILEDIRHVYDNQTRYHRDRAAIYESCQQPSQARQSLERVVELDPLEVEARVDIARLWLQELLFHYDLSLTRRMMESLRPALALSPDHRDALFYNSLALAMAAGLPHEQSPALTAEGMAQAGRILERDSTDLPARMLLAVHCMDIGQTGAAAEQFELALAGAPADVRAAFLTSRWTAPVAALKVLETRDDAGRASYDRVYWRHHDPSPLTDLNENQMEIWKRLAMADFLFAKPGKGIRGWDTAPGEAFIRYGAPPSHEFDPGDIIGLPGVDQRLPYAGGGADISSSTPRIRLDPPTWNWQHEFRGLAVTAVGVRGEPGRDRVNVYLGIPLWRPLGVGRWLENVSMEIVVRDTSRAIVRQVAHRANREDVVSMFGDPVEALLLNQIWELYPGRYTITGYVEDRDRKLHGVYSGPIEIRDYDPAPVPIISDMDLTLRSEPLEIPSAVTRLGTRYIPNPLRVIGDARQLDLFHEIYGLTTRSEMAFVETRYTILPAAWVQGYDRLVRLGEESTDRLVQVAASDALLADSELGRDNYLDVTFPPAGLPVTNGRASRGTRVPVTDLAPGEYSLIMTVTDLHAGKSATATALFQVLSEEQRRELAEMGRREVLRPR